VLPSGDSLAGQGTSAVTAARDAGQICHPGIVMKAFAVEQIGQVAFRVKPSIITS
jgi:hypothetical protein